ncbi:MAG: LytR/AlgR family response regulator transcription factor [Crocinitomicaceae bacterium]
MEQKKELHGYNQLEVLQNNLTNQDNSQYVLRTHREEFIININDIIHLEADGMYTNIVMDGDRITASKPMKDILSDLPNTFFRTHRSYAINLDQVLKPVRITQNGIMTKQKTIVPLSARKKDLFMQEVGKV